MYRCSWACTTDSGLAEQLLAAALPLRITCRALSSQFMPLLALKTTGGEAAAPVTEGPVGLQNVMRLDETNLISLVLFRFQI